MNKPRLVSDNPNPIAETWSKNLVDLEFPPNGGRGRWCPEYIGMFEHETGGEPIRVFHSGTSGARLGPGMNPRIGAGHLHIHAVELADLASKHEKVWLALMEDHRTEAAYRGYRRVELVLVNRPKLVEG